MNNKIVITVERINEDKIVEQGKFEVSEDTGIDDWGYLFKSILSFVTFDLNQIKELFNE